MNRNIREKPKLFKPFKNGALHILIGNILTVTDRKSIIQTNEHMNNRSYDKGGQDDASA
jgi:hypothetical protein